MPKIDVNVSENVTDLANKPIHNLFDKSTAALGNGLASAFSLVFAPIEYLGQSAQLNAFNSGQDPHLAIAATKRTLKRTNKNSKTR